METVNEQNRIKPGAIVKADGGGHVGTVEQAFIQPETGRLLYLTVGTDTDAQRLTIPAEMIQSVGRDGEVHLKPGGYGEDGAREAIPPNRNQTYYQGEDIRVPLAEEHLKVDKRAVDLGEVKLQKVVDQVEETLQVPLTHDEFELERVPVNKPALNPVQPFYRGDVLVIPIIKEVLVVQKQLMVVEEVQIRRRPVTKPEEVREKVRRERLEVESGQEFVARDDLHNQPQQ